jgi:plastocyanin
VLDVSRMTCREINSFFMFWATMPYMFTKISILPLILALVATVASSPAVTVHMPGSSYNPANVQVHAGDTVLFVNDDKIAHTVTDSASNPSFDSKDIAAGQSWSYTFTRPGTYSYVCTYHPWMKGQITVVARK